MLQWNLAAHLSRLGIENANQLTARSGLGYPTCWRIFQGGALAEIDTNTLETLGRLFDVDPRTLLDWTPD